MSSSSGARSWSRSRRRSRSFPFPHTVLLVIFIVSQMWVRCHCTRAAITAFRSFPVASSTAAIQPAPSIITRTARERLLQKYFHGSALKFTGPDRVFEESKRKVPSCPDPLHN